MKFHFLSNNLHINSFMDHLIQLTRYIFYYKMIKIYFMTINAL